MRKSTGGTNRGEGWQARHCGQRDMRSITGPGRRQAARALFVLDGPASNVFKGAAVYYTRTASAIEFVHVIRCSKTILPQRWTILMIFRRGKPRVTKQSTRPDRHPAVRRT